MGSGVVRAELWPWVVRAGELWSWVVRAGELWPPVSESQAEEVVGVWALG